MPTRKITVREFVEDVRSGMSYAELMSKYSLSQKQLFEVYERMLEAKKLNLDDLERQNGNGETIAGPAATCSACGASKASETDLCQQCGAGDTVTVSDRKHRREVPVKTDALGEPVGRKRAPVFDTQVMEARLDVSRAARVHPEWVAPSGQYDLGEYVKHGGRGRRRLLSAKQIVYIALGTAFLAALLFLGLAFYDEIESYLSHWRKSTTAGGLQSAVGSPHKPTAPPAGRDRQDRLHRDVASVRPPTVSASSETQDPTHKAAHKSAEEAAPRDVSGKSSIPSRSGIDEVGEPSESKSSPHARPRGEAQPESLSSGVAAGKVDPVARASLDRTHPDLTSDDRPTLSLENIAKHETKSVVAPEVSPTPGQIPVASTPQEREARGGTESLIAAIQKGDTAKAAELIARGADSNAADPDGVTALMHAVRRGNGPLVQLLLAKGADARTKNRGGRCALDLALRGENATIVGLILPHHRERGEELLLEASSDGRKNVVEVLLANGVDPNARDGLGNTALMRAASSGSLEIARLLLDKGADPRATNKEGATALGYAYSPSATTPVSLSIQREMVQLLKQREPGLRTFGKRSE